MSGKYYIAEIKQLHSKEEKEKYLAESETGAVHLPGKILSMLLKGYREQHVYCESCKQFHTRSSEIR